MITYHLASGSGNATGAQQLAGFCGGWLPAVTPPPPTVTVDPTVGMIGSPQRVPLPGAGARQAGADGADGNVKARKTPDRLGDAR